jgi:hypothetical protein
MSARSSAPAQALRTRCITAACRWWSRRSFRSASKDRCRWSRRFTRTSPGVATRWFCSMRFARSCMHAIRRAGTIGQASSSTRRCHGTWRSNWTGCATSRPRRAVDAALERIDAAVDDGDTSRGPAPDASLTELHDTTAHALEQLPTDGPFAIECIGLRASARKRLAQSSFRAHREGWPGTVEEGLLRPAGRGACRLRSRGARTARRRRATLQRVATLHWLAVQLESLGSGPGEALEAGPLGSRQAVR